MGSMVTLGKVELKANKDVKAGEETTLSELFTFDERRKEFTLEGDVERDKTKLKVSVSKLGALETTADTTKKKGEKTNLWMLLKVADFSKKVKSSQEIKKGDTLAITIETA
ncbi:MAG: hypothetical protein N3H31_05915 [Candidatus Nezhaarchaeota archaeon]|nr:hypothetical protein [Candidatus Nezhaarchaeota archaeon]